MDIEGAFDNTSFDSIEEAADRKGFHPAITSWIRAMLSCRKTTANIAGVTATIEARKGCPQGGVLSPLLWSIVVDDLLDELTGAGYAVQGYADDLVIAIRGQMGAIVSHSMQRALDMTSVWCQKKGLRINPTKTVLVPFTRRRKLNITAPSLGGARIDLQKEVKYLGVIIDQKLTWSSHLNKVCIKANFAMHTCRRMLGRNWGLRPDMIHWTYKAIIRPMVTYAALAWWPKTTQRAAQAKLQHIQRLACLSITGAMSTCPTAAMEAMLGLLPLHLHVQREAVSDAIRISRINKLCPADYTGHMKILRTSGLEWITQYPSDVMSAKFNFEPNYKVAFVDRETWKAGGPQFKKGSLQWFTDGSKREEGPVGAGIYGPRCRISVPMGKNSTIFQAEIFAINCCALTIQDKGMRGATIDILTDSEAALKALTAYTCESKLVWECLNNLKVLSSRNYVTLWWVPGHEGVEGNEGADRLAKLGSGSPYYGPEPCCGAARSNDKKHVRGWEEKLKTSFWANVKGQHQAKKFISLSPQRIKEILTLEKGDIKILTGLYTGHFCLKYHLSRIGKAEDDNCRLCGEAAETTEHILCTCPAAGRHRLSTMGQVFTSPDRIRDMDPRQVIRFYKNLDLPNA